MKYTLPHSISCPPCAACGRQIPVTLPSAEPGYCDVCRPQIDRAKTERLGAGLASIVTGCSASLLVPLLWPSAGLIVVLPSVLGMTLLPILIGSMWSRVRVVGDSMWRGSWLLASGLLLSAPLTVAAHSFYHPELRVLNLSDGELAISVDGKPLFVLPRTSSESPLSGARVRLSAGVHELIAVDRHGQEAKHSVDLVAGRQHFYAPMSLHHCFALETTRYGREGTEVTRQPLPKGEAFVLLPVNVDLWLSPAPPSNAAPRWSGGVVSSLRQAPCAQEPAR